MIYSIVIIFLLTFYLMNSIAKRASADIDSMQNKFTQDRDRLGRDYQPAKPKEYYVDIGGDRYRTCPYLNADISNWDLSNVTSIQDMFKGAV